MTMKAFILSLTTSQAVGRADDGADDQGDGERNGHHQPFGRERVMPRPMPCEQNRMPVTIAVERGDGFDRQVHVAGDDDDGETDRHDADEGRLLDDVGEDADLEEIAEW